MVWEEKAHLRRTLVQLFSSEINALRKRQDLPLLPWVEPPHRCFCQ